jgi:hypothetical protein
MKYKSRYLVASLIFLLLAVGLKFFVDLELKEEAPQGGINRCHYLTILLC